MESCSLDELKAHFESKIERLTTCMNLAAEVIGLGAPVAECREQLIAINSELCLAESAVGQLREHLKVQRQELETAKLAKEQLSEQVAEVHYAETHLPERLPCHKPQPQSNSKEQSNNRAPLVPRQTNDDNQAPPSSRRANGQSQKKPRLVPRMEYLMVDEFKDVPKYMKGRLSYDSINSIIDGINLTVKTKYALTHKSPITLSEFKRKKYHKYKEQETKNTKGIYFFIDDDFKTYSKMKYDSTARSCITILRHCGRLREIRGGGCTRLALIYNGLNQL